jgi:hypothetical protein
VFGGVYSGSFFLAASEEEEQGGFERLRGLLVLIWGL